MEAEHKAAVSLYPPPFYFLLLPRGKSQRPLGLGSSCANAAAFTNQQKQTVEGSARAMRVPKVSLGRGRRGESWRCLGLPQPWGGNVEAPPLRRREGTRERCGW